MIVLGPFRALPGTQQIQAPISTDVYAIGLINVSPLFMSVQEAGTYASMAVPPFSADVFYSPDSASQSLTVVLTNLAVQASQNVYYATSYNYFYIYLYGANDYISQCMQNGTSTGYPYPIPLTHQNPYIGTIGTTGASTIQTQQGVTVTSATAATPFTATLTDAYLWGFDLAFNTNTGVSTHANFTLSDMGTPGNTLGWMIEGTANTVIPPISIRFPFPIAITGSQPPAGNASVFGTMQTTYTVPTIGNSFFALTLYSSQ